MADYSELLSKLKKTSSFESKEAILSKHLNNYDDFRHIVKRDFLLELLQYEEQSIKLISFLFSIDISKKRRKDSLLLLRTYRALHYSQNTKAKNNNDPFKNLLWNEFIEVDFLFYLFHPFISLNIFRYRQSLDVGDKTQPLFKIILSFFVWLLTLSSLIVGVTLGVNASTNAYKNTIDKKTIQLMCDSKYEDGSPLLSRIYGDGLDLSKLSISYQKNTHDRTYQEFVTVDMLEEYDEEKIGYQTSYIKFNNVKLKLVINTSPLGLNVPNVIFANKTLTWSAINNATSYKVYCDKDKDNLQYLAETDKTTFDLSNLNKAGYLYFGVEAVNPSEKYVSSKISQPVEVLKLEKPNGLAYSVASTHRIIWDEVSDADYYSLTIDGSTHSNITDLYFDYDASAGTHKISLTAYSALQNSIESESLYTFSMLPQVSEISYDGNYLNWNAVENATSYDVYLDGSTTPINCLENKLDLSTYPAKVYAIDIIAKNFSSAVFDSNPAHFDILINFKAKLSNEVLSWPNLGDGYSYYLYLDNDIFSTGIVDSNIDLRMMSIASGNHSIKVLAKHVSSAFLNEYSNDVSFTKLVTPILTIEGDYVVASGSSIQATFYLDGVEFNGNISSISAGDHVITAKYFATNDSQIDSDTGILNIHKLSTPVVSVINDNIVVDYPTRDIKYYLDGVEFDGDLGKISSGNHSLIAKYIGNGVNIIDSSLSTPIIINKLPAPSIKVENHEIICYENNINVKYYCDNEPFNGSYDSLTRGLHTIKAYNVGDGSTTISSIMSSDLIVYKSNAQISAVTSGTNKVIATLTSDDNVVSMQMSVEFYKNSNLIDSIDYPVTTKVPFSQTISIVRKEGAADKLIIKANIVISYNKINYEDTIVYEFII